MPHEVIVFTAHAAKADNVPDGMGRFPMGGRHLQQDGEEFSDGKAKGNSVRLTNASHWIRFSVACMLPVNFTG